MGEMDLRLTNRSPIWDWKEQGLNRGRSIWLKYPKFIQNLVPHAALLLRPLRTPPPDSPKSIRLPIRAQGRWSGWPEPHGTGGLPTAARHNA